MRSSQARRFVPGVNWLLCHAALESDELRAITPESARQRDFERRFYGGATGRAELEAARVEGIGMRPLRDLIRS